MYRCPSALSCGQPTAGISADMQPCGCMGCATCLQEMGTQYTYSGREAARCPVTDAEERSAGLEYMILNHEYISGLLKVREEDSYKGTYGHALVIAGSVGMMGAAILAAGGALKSGCGLVTVHVPYSERLSIHLSHPSAIVECDPGHLSPGYQETCSDTGPQA